MENDTDTDEAVLWDDDAIPCQVQYSSGSGTVLGALLMMSALQGSAEAHAVVHSMIHLYGVSLLLLLCKYVQQHTHLTVLSQH